MNFAESLFFPIPPDVMLAPMCLANPRRAWWLAPLTTLTSVAGRLFGYAIGYFAIYAVLPWLQESRYRRIADINKFSGSDGRQWLCAWASLACRTTSSFRSCSMPTCTS